MDALSRWTALILASVNKGDRSYGQLAQDCDGNPSSQRLQQIATTRGLKAFPDPSNVRALARGLHVSESTVVLAAAASLGLEVAEVPQLVALLPPRSTDLTQDQVQALVALVRSIVGDASAAGRAQDRTPGPRLKAVADDGEHDPVAADRRSALARRRREELEAERDKCVTPSDGPGPVRPEVALRANVGGGSWRPPACTTRGDTSAR